MLTAESVKSIFNYDPETGHLTWATKMCKKFGVGDRVGSVDAHGYRQVNVCKNWRKEHRVIWLWMTGEWPDGQIDHINGVRDDNRWVNLRVVTNLQNAQNRTKVVSKTGLLGVSLRKSTGKYEAHIREGGRKIHLGYFDTAEQAHAIYLKAKSIYHLKASG